MEGDLDVTVQSDRWIKGALEASEGDGSMGLTVDVEAEMMLIEVKQDAHHTALSDAPLCAVRVDTSLHEPTAGVVHVHTPTLFILT